MFLDASSAWVHGLGVGGGRGGPLGAGGGLQKAWVWSNQSMLDSWCGFRICPVLILLLHADVTLEMIHVYQSIHSPAPATKHSSNSSFRQKLKCTTEVWGKSPPAYEINLNLNSMFLFISCQNYEYETWLGDCGQCDAYLLSSGICIGT